MLLQTYHLKIVNNHCMPGAQSVNCIANLEQDISCVIPYLNSALGGSQCTQEPSSVTFKTEGKLISVQGSCITVNGIKDEEQARRIVEWMVREVNETWDNRAAITPHYQQPERPSITDLLRLLPQTNCRECGEPTCMVFAVRLAEGAKDPSQCTKLTNDDRYILENYHSAFSWD